MALKDLWNQAKDAVEQGVAQYEQAKADGTLDAMKEQAKATATDVAAQIKNKLGPKQ